MKQSVTSCETGRREALKGIAAVPLAHGLAAVPSWSASTSIGVRAATTVVDESDKWTWLPAWRLKEMIARREASSVEIVDHFLNRIEELDPKLYAFRKVDAKGAREQALLADMAVRTGENLGCLHGVPIAVKELFLVKGYPVPGSYFSYLEKNNTAPVTIALRDDIEVERLRASGAIIVGVTVGALGPDQNGQLTRNPWNVLHTAGGSSTGNGAAVAGGLVPLAIGDDGAGSVRCPLIGLHPTRGRIPHVDYKSLATRATVTVGPMTRSARDAAIAMQVLAGPDGRDVICLQDDAPDYSALLASGGGGQRFAWTDDFGLGSMPHFVRSPNVISAAKIAAQRLKRIGAILSDVTTTWENPMPSWAAINQLGSSQNQPASSQIPESDLHHALAGRQRNWQTFRETFKNYDFVVSPTMFYTAPTMEEWIELTQMPLQAGWLGPHLAMCNVLGLPAISIPAGFVSNMPIGIHVIGRPSSEASLLRIAQGFLSTYEK